VIANNAAIANLLVVPGTPFIYIRNNNNGSSTLALDGTLGSITVAPDISLAGRLSTVPAIENLAGNNTISGNFTLSVGGTYILQSDSGTLTLTQPWPYAPPGGVTSSRNLTLTGAGIITMAGVIQDGSLNGTNVPVNILKSGSGTLNLPLANTYSGTTIVSNGVLSLAGTIGTNTATVAGGLLVGTGTITGPVTVLSAGAIEAGTTNTIGTLNLGSTLALSGNTVVKINKSAGTNDLFTGQTSVTYGGTLTVTNLAGTLTTSDTFTLFSPGASASNFASIIGSPGPGLAYSFANGVLSVVGVNTNSPKIQFGVSGNTLMLSWPTNLNWILQSQTNSLSVGLSTNWADVVGSASVTNMNFTINPTNPTVFYRMRLP
jgi:autotransporter-associated beta strand protein